MIIYRMKGMKQHTFFLPLNTPISNHDQIRRYQGARQPGNENF